MTIKTEHRGHEISYKESDEMWACIDVGYRHNELSKVKARIDKMYRDEREANAVPCFEIDGVYRGRPELVSARIVEYEAKTDKAYSAAPARRR